MLAVIGENGAGKSTTIRMIMSILLPDSGTIRVLDGSALDAKDRIGYLPEERGVYRKMRVADFLRGQAEQLAAQAGADSPRLRALDALQARLALDSGKADAWTAAVRDARR